MKTMGPILRWIKVLVKICFAYRLASKILRRDGGWGSPNIGFLAKPGSSREFTVKFARLNSK